MALSDQELIDRFVQSGDDQAFEALVQRHIAKIRRYALVIARAESDADEIVQEVLIVLFRKLHTFRAAAAFGTWLFQIVRNRGRDVLRRRRNRPTTDLSFFAEVLPAPGPEPAEVLHRRILSEAVYRELEKAPDLDRQLFYLRESEDLSFPEIARLLSLPEGTIKARLWRFKAKLAERLAPLHEEVVK